MNIPNKQVAFRGVLASLIATAALQILIPDPAPAQVTTAITPTTGLGNLGTAVTPNGSTYNIAGGTRPGNGANLFHSFGLFSVGAGDTANFTNATPALPTSNILGRVTGGQVSNIFGTIQTIEFPGANLFLMNPAGIVFGPTASLNVGGAVNFTTADYLRMADQVGNAGIFYANPLQSTVLTTAPVVAFGFLTSTPAPITVQGSTLTVPPGQMLAFVGGDITLAADPVTGSPTTIQAPSGQIQIVSVASPGEVLTPSLNFGPNVTGQSFTSFGTTTLSGGTTLDVSGDGSGTIVIRGGRLIMDSAMIAANTFGDVDGATTAVDVSVQDTLTMTNGSLIQAAGFATAKPGQVSLTGRTVLLEQGSAVQVATTDADGGGVLSVQAETLTLRTGASLVTASFGSGQSGPVIVTASDSLTMTGADSFIQSQAFASGPGGPLMINAKSAVLDSSSITSFAFDVGNSGNIALHLQDSLTITGKGAIGTFSGGTGSAGNITISAGGTVLVSGGAGSASPSQISILGGEGVSGAIFIEAARLILSEGALIQNEALAQKSGDISILAHESAAITSGSAIRLGIRDVSGGVLTLTAPTITLDNATLRARTAGLGDAGAMVLTADNLSVVNSRILTTTSGTGRGGDVTVKVADTLIIKGQFSDPSEGTSPAGIFTDTRISGNAGNVGVTVRTLAISEGGRIDSSTSGSGQGGATNISASNGISIVGTGTAISSTTNGSGAGGAIQIQAGSLQLSDAASVSGASTGSGNSGTVNIQTGGNFVMSGGTVATSATQGQGGNITVGAGQQVQMNSNALISANSTGSGNAGDILVSAGDAILLNASKITTEAAQASGGNITLMAPNLIQLVNSTVSSSVQGGVQTIGGNITIDPQFVILQNSQIIAQAFQGQGGNINITAGVLLVDGTSVIDASSQFGVNGTVSIQSPLSNLSQVVNPLQRSTLQAAALLRERCAVRAQSGSMSSLTVRGRDVAPAAPGGMLSSSLVSLGSSPGPAAGGASQSVARESVVPTPALLEISGELMRPFAQQAFGSCGS